MSTHSAHKHWWQTFEAVFGIPFLAAIVLQVFLPLSFPRGFLTPVFIFTGTVFITVGAILVVLARQALAQRGQPTDPGFPTNELVTTGVFSISRNPLYLGGICFLAGIALAVNLPWVLALLAPAIVACHIILVAPEERYLAARFGEKYRAYSASVHRWWGRARRSM
jgi:protein-S-isoprenylcysteine O-methyltransferase Ste14